MYPIISRSAVRRATWVDYELLATGRLDPFEGPRWRTSHQVDEAAGPEPGAHDGPRDASGAAVVVSPSGRPGTSGSVRRRRHAPYMYTCRFGRRN